MGRPGLEPGTLGLKDRPALIRSVSAIPADPRFRWDNSENRVPVCVHGSTPAGTFRWDGKTRGKPAGSFWQGCWSARSVEAVEVNGYTIEPGADLAGARANEDTIWPEGFDPEIAGVTFE